MPRSVRFRTTAVAVAVVAIALTLGSIALVALLRERLTDQVRTTTQLRARDIAATLDAGTPPSRLALGSDDEEADVAQVFDGRGRVVAASDNIRGEPALDDMQPGESKRVGLPVDDDGYLAVAAATRDRDFTVVVARTLEVADESSATVSRLLLLGSPLLLALVGFVVWTLTGVALRPVDAMRREVDGIGASDLDHRVTDPGAGDEISRLAATMNRMLERLQRAQARERRFVSDASHELRSPVATLRQHAEVALAHPDRTTASELAARTHHEAMRLQQLIDDLLVLARADEGALDLRTEPLDVDDIVFDEARRLRATTALDVSTTSVSAGRIDGDRRAVVTVVRNLADNAARYATARVGFHLAQANGTVTLHVDDDGPGIAPDERDRVRERFVRLDGARSRDAGGSGLGLAIVAELVAAHHGTLTIGTSPWKGTRVEVTFRAGSGES